MYKNNISQPLAIANKQVAYLKGQNLKLALQLTAANKELRFQNKEKGKRAAELTIANEELAFETSEKSKRAVELTIANKELVFESSEKGKRAAELTIANKELVFESSEKGKRAAELTIANKELAFETSEKGKRAAELTIANKELVFQEAEKEKRAAEFEISADELKKSENQFQLMVDNIKDYAIFMLDTDGRVATWNSGAKNIKGYTEDEIIGKPLNVFYTSEQIAAGEPERNLQMTLQYGHLETEGLRVRKDGTTFYASIFFTAILDKTGKLYGFSKITKDISEIKKAQQDLKKLNEELEQKVNERTEKLSHSLAFNAGVLNSLESHIAVLDFSGNIIAVNNMWKQIAKENGDALLQNTNVGDNYFDVCKKAKNEDNKEAARVAKGIQDVMHANIRNFYMEYACHSATEQCWFAMRVVKFENNEPMVVIAHQNITERKQAETKLHQLTFRLMLATESVQLGIWSWDIMNDILTWDNYMYKIYKIENGQFNLTFEGWQLRVHPEDKQMNETQMKLAIEGIQDYHSEFRIVLDDLSVRYLKATGIVERDDEGNAISMIGTNWDITELKAAEKMKDKTASDIIRRNKDLEQFSYIVSHNLRAPIANILGITAIINEPTNGTELNGKMISALSTSANQLDATIKDLNYILQVKREMTDTKEWVKFSEIVGNINDSISNIIEKDNVKIKTDFTAVDDMFTLKGYLYSVFYNLISNSIKYRQPGTNPLIEITSLKTKETTVLLFKDNGLGIDLNKSGKQVFGLYKRFHTHAADGKGMGLYMVKTQVEMLGGTIAIQSEINMGTEFRIEFGNDDLTSE